MGKENVYMYNGTVFIIWKEGNPTACKNTDETGGHQETEWNKPDTKYKYCMISLICGI